VAAAHQRQEAALAGTVASGPRWAGKSSWAAARASEAGLGAGDEQAREGAEGLPADFAVLGRGEIWAGRLAGFLLSFFSISIPFLIKTNKI
jgi:hypothetical protein